MIATISNYLTRQPRWALLSFAATLLGLFLTCVSLLADLAREYSELGMAAERLDRFERRIPKESMNAPAVIAPPGEPFLDELTLTMASAALLQRMTSAIARVGGTIVSSEVDTQNAQSKDGYIKVSATCNLAANALQQLLYEVESGMPFLFVDQLLAQADTEPNKDGQLKATLVVTGLWKVAK